MQSTRDTEPSPQEAADMDQFRPAKKTKLEGGSLHITAEVRDEMADVDDDEDWDDIYGANQAAAENPASMVEKEVGSGAVLPVADEQAVQGAAAEPMEDAGMTAANGPGTFAMAPAGRVEDDVEPAAQTTESAQENAGQLTDKDVHGLSIHATPEPESVEAKMEAAGEDELVDERNPTLPSTDEASTRMIQDTSILEPDAPLPTSAAPSTLLSTDGLVGTTVAGSEDAKEGAETAFDSEYNSDTSDDTDSDDSSTSESEEEEYESLNARDLAQILMKGEDGDGDNKSTAGGDRQPRTANEAKPEVRPPPDIPMTADTKVTRLGDVREVVEGQILINGGSGGTQIVGLDTPLCNKDRKIIGVVCDVLGSQLNTFYAVAFNSQQEIDDFGLSRGVDVYYLNDHVKWEFTEQIRKMGKGTDASNIHDEEVDFDEQDFSDDEKEAEYKRMNKASKKDGKGPLSRSEFVQGQHQGVGGQTHRGGFGNQRGDRGGNRGQGGRGRGRGRGNFNRETIGGRDYTVGAPSVQFTGRPGSRGNDQPTTHYPSGGLNYGDDEPVIKPEPGVADGEYTKLSRPDNYGTFQAPSEPEPGMRPHIGSDDFGSRGRGQGLGYHNTSRGGGDRGRGKRGDWRGNNNRGRGGQQGNRGPSNSYPDAHNNNNFGNSNGFGQLPQTQLQQKYPAWNATSEFQREQKQQYIQPPQQQQQYPLFQPPQVSQGYPPGFQQPPAQQQAWPTTQPQQYAPQPQQQMTPELVAQWQAYFAAQAQQQHGGYQPR